MKINFLTIGISKKSGGAIYDSEFFEILKEVFPQTQLIDDDYFKKKYHKKEIGLVGFNKIYRDNIDFMFDCDYLIMNSRIYTRFIFSKLYKISKKTHHTKLIIIHHHNNYMNNYGVKKYIHKYYELKLLSIATELIIPNIYIIEYLENKYNIHNIKKLPSSFEKKTYNKSTLNNKKILFVGNIERRKGLLYGIKAFELLNYKDYSFIIAGNYSSNKKYYNYLKAYIEKKKLADKIRFVGRVNEEELNHLYETADVFLFPSMLEGYGWVMIEAMGRGVPVVAFDNSAMPYTVKNDFNGKLVPNKNWREMGEALNQIISNEKYRESLQIGALETFNSVPSKEDLKRMTKEYVKTWS